MSLPTINPTQTSAWQKLQTHFDATKDLRMQDLFAQDAERAARFHIQWQDFLLDYSKNRITAETMALLQALATEVGLSDAIEKYFTGDIINQTENRAVLHTALRSKESSPLFVEGEDIRPEIAAVKAKIKIFSQGIISGAHKGFTGKAITDVVNIGIGGSDLGPAMLADALAFYQNHLNVHFVSNVDGDHVQEVLKKVNPETTLFVIVSKTFTTQETLSNAQTIRTWFLKAGTEKDIAAHFVAVSTNLQKVQDFGIAPENIFPMWDWVGGRTSEMSAVGLLPAMLQGIDIDAMLAGAREMDTFTRSRELTKNPAALLALMWFHAGNGGGTKDMVILPYKDRLLLLSRYLQQLVMESLGKAKDLDGKTVHQGIAVYGNKGSTDQHAYVQQLRDGLHNFFVTFIEVLKDRDGSSRLVEKDATSGDYLLGFLLGTRQALFESDRQSITLTIPDVSPRTLGALIALFERVVGLYAHLIHINAYHQPGVEAGKKAAATVLEIQRQLLSRLRSAPGARTAEQLAQEIGTPDDVETAFKVLEHMAANPDHGVNKIPGAAAFDARYQST